MEDVEVACCRAPLWAFRILPITACVLVIVTYVSLVVYAKSTGVYTGGIDMPFFSDTGRDEPAYYWFAVLLTIAAVIYAACHLLIAEVLLKFLEYAAPLVGEEALQRGCCSLPTSVKVAGVFAVVSAPFLAILACFDTARHADVHAYSAYVFFGLNIVTLTIYSIVFWLMPSSMDKLPVEEARQLLQTSSYAKAVIGVCFWIGFMLYIPIGLAVACDGRLSMHDCIHKEDLGVGYCTAREKDDDPSLTLLWDYSNCTGANTMRSASQFVSIAMLLLFSASLALDFGLARYRSGSPNPGGDEPVADHLRK